MTEEAPKTPEPNRILLAENAVDFLLGGDARFTLRSKKTQQRYTYRVSQTDFDPKKYFVSYLVGSDNEHDYAYIGMLVNSGRKFIRTDKSKLLLDSLPIKAFMWTLDKLFHGEGMPDQLEIWHEGRCGRCGRTLTVPESIASGFGPECQQIRGKDKHLHPYERKQACAT